MQLGKWDKGVRWHGVPLKLWLIFGPLCGSIATLGGIAVCLEGHFDLSLLFLGILWLAGALALGYWATWFLNKQPGIDALIVDKDDGEGPSNGPGD